MTVIGHCVLCTLTLHALGWSLNPFRLGCRAPLGDAGADDEDRAAHVLVVARVAAVSRGSSFARRSSWEMSSPREPATAALLHSALCAHKSQRVGSRRWKFVPWQAGYEIESNTCHSTAGKVTADSRKQGCSVRKMSPVASSSWVPLLKAWRSCNCRPPGSGVDVPSVSGEQRLRILRWLLSKAGPYPVQKLLLARNNNGSTPLHVAAHVGLWRVVELLLEAADAESCASLVIDAVTQNGATLAGHKRTRLRLCATQAIPSCVIS